MTFHISPEAIALARQRVSTWTETDGTIAVAICDGSNVWQAIGIKPSPDQAQLVTEHVESNVRALASFVQLGLDAGAADREALASLRRLALDAVNAVGLCPCTNPENDCAKIRALSDALPPEVE